MAYIGAEPIVGNFQVCDAISVVNGQAAYTMQVASTNVNPESANHMLVSLNGVLQKPGSSFTISGSTITFASNLATGDVIDFIILLGDVLNIGTPSDDAVKTASLQANAVTGAKLNTDVISAQTALTSAPADTDEFLVSDAGTIKRIDYSLIKGGGQWEHLLTSTASTSSSIAFSSTYITTTYLDYMIVCSGIKTSDNGATAAIHMSTDNGSSYLSAYRETRMGYKSSDATANAGNQSASAIYIQGGAATGQSAGQGFDSVITIFDPLKQSGTTDKRTVLNAFSVHHDTSANLTVSNVAGATKVNTAVNNIKFSFDTGTIASGKVSLYGRKIS